MRRAGDRVVHVLFGRPLIAGDCIGPNLVGLVNESRAASARGGEFVVHVVPECGRLHIRIDDVPAQPVRSPYPADRSLLVNCSLTVGDARGIEVITELTSTHQESIGIEFVCRGHKVRAASASGSAVMPNPF